MSLTVKNNIFITLIGLLLFVPFLGAVHLFDWDEINFAECAREMIVTGDYSLVQINFQPFWEKPPLFIWMQVMAMKLFGINEFAARFPNAVCGIVTLLVIYNIGRKIYDHRFGWYWVMAYAGSLLPHFYFKSGIIDPWFNLFIFCGIYFFILVANDSSSWRKNLLLAAVMIGLGIMTKGPVALLIFLLCTGVYWMLIRFKLFFSFRQVLFFFSVVTLIGGSWFLLLFLNGRGDVVIQFVEYQVRLFRTEDAGHGGPFYYHALVLLAGCFPASVLALGAFKTTGNDTPFQRFFKRWMIILFSVVLVLFSIVETKIVHYSSLCWLPLTYLAAYTCHQLLAGNRLWKKWMTWMLISIGILLSIAFTLAPLIEHYKHSLITTGWIKDNVAMENLKAEVVWQGWEWVTGIVFIAGILYAVLLMNKNNYKTGIRFLFITGMVTTGLVAIALVPRVERYSQGAAIDFYSSKQNEDCYIETLEFKSYANLFYPNKRWDREGKSEDFNWLVNGDVDKPVYIVAKINAANIPANLVELYRKNGFVFYRRDTIGKQ